MMSQPPASEFQNGVGGVMIRVPPGSFMMGSPESEDGHRVWEAQRDVSFVNEFYLGSTPVTQAQYEAVTGTNPTDHGPESNAPVDSVNWDQAHEFCRKLTEHDIEADLIPDDWAYRLPTEAEWEYACQAGRSGPRHGELQEVAWYYGNSDDKPHAVGLKSPNAWGFYDMLGNVWEWCQDWFDTNRPTRSARGGSYFNSSRFCRSAQRWGWNPKSRGRYSGLRLLAAATATFELSPPIDDFQPTKRQPSIYDAIDSDDFDLALQVFTRDPAAIESVDLIPPPLHCCIFGDKPDMLAWLLDHGANIHQREQDYGALPLNTAVVMRRKRIIRVLVERGADTTQALDHAQRGLAGAFEDDPSLDREGYRDVIELLRELGIDSGS